MVLSDDVTRSPDLVPIRHGRMATDPFAFYRGAAAIMVADLATTPSSGVVAQLCGDAHLSNFGVFASPERQLLFDLNDFEFASAYADQNDADFEALSAGHRRRPRRGPRGRIRPESARADNQRQIQSRSRVSPGPPPRRTCACTPLAVTDRPTGTGRVDQTLKSCSGAASSEVVPQSHGGGRC
jgi:hypothetical protein